ncbi:MAG: hypothetical protein D6812_10755 [Deltaproteobacteria bacterium]|nr:MAG: hypothetical protein D6812_10755 [Deltaproteobacteria bacterium]
MWAFIAHCGIEARGIESRGGICTEVGMTSEALLWDGDQRRTRKAEEQGVLHAPPRHRGRSARGTSWDAWGSTFGLSGAYV